MRLIENTFDILLIYYNRVGLKIQGKPMIFIQLTEKSLQYTKLDAIIKITESHENSRFFTVILNHITNHLLPFMEGIW